MKKILYMFLFGLAFLTISSCSNKKDDTNKDNSDAKTYDNEGIYQKIDGKIYFGSYPQSLVSDPDTLAILNDRYDPLYNKDKVDYGYFEMDKKEPLMSYIDIDYDDNPFNGYEYRCIIFYYYRPVYTPSFSSKYNSYQDDNSYFVENIYWFKYEKIEWNILEEDEKSYTLISNLILDSQDYYYKLSNEVVEDEEEIHVNNYSSSNIRKWLNETFYNQAFKVLEKDIFIDMEIDNSLSSTGDRYNDYICDNTNDKLSILSITDLNKYYPLNDDINYEKRYATSTDYANSQGLYVSRDEETKLNCKWMLRTPSNTSQTKVKVVKEDGKIDEFEVNSTFNGIRPICKIKL